MAKFQIPRSEFTPHPEGEHVGTIIEIRDEGLRETRYGTKHKLVIVIESQSATKEDGEPYSLWVWCTISSSSKATLTQLRQKLLRRPLTDEERLDFDADREMLGRKVKYFVQHNFSDDGQVFANLVTWSPLEQGQAARQAREQLQEGQESNAQQEPGEEAEAAPVPVGEDEDLTF